MPNHWADPRTHQSVFIEIFSKSYDSVDVAPNCGDGSDLAAIFFYMKSILVRM